MGAEQYDKLCVRDCVTCFKLRDDNIVRRQEVLTQLADSFDINSLEYVEDWVTQLTAARPTLETFRSCIISYN